MKKTPLILTIAIFVFLGNSDYFDYSYSNGNLSPIKIIKENYDRDFDHFYYSIQNLQHSVHEDDVTEEVLQDKVTASRMAYKRIEYILEYMDPESAIRYVNGAPLPKIEQGTAALSIQEPCGLQTLDELVFSDEAIEEIDLIAQLVDNLEVQVRQLHQQQRSITLEHRYIIEGIRYGVLRVYTLGLTGFDTPGSVHAIPEAIVALAAMKASLDTYKNMKSDKAKSMLSQILENLDTSIDILEKEDSFDDLDRLALYRNHIGPVYRDLLAFHKASEIELKKESDRSLSAHNYMEEELFTERLFNVSYFTQVAQEDLKNPDILALGKSLFNDNALSQDLSLSCASCHDPKKGFTDGLPKSHTNHKNLSTRRHSPTLLNSAIYGRYFWDMREYDLERQIKHVASDSLEFNINLIDLAERLMKNEDYISRFKQAYGNRDKYVISSWSISNALASYVASLTSFNSPFDQYIRGESETYSQEAYDGYNLFMGKAACGTCHFAPAFNGTVPPYYKDSESEVLGITMGFDTLNPILDGDLGRAANGRVDEAVWFYHNSIKTATVRNVEITAPYMHNGSFATLEDVVRFYNEGGGAGMGLEVPHQTLPDAKLGLSKYEISALVSFMKTLTDTTGMTSLPVERPFFDYGI